MNNSNSTITTEIRPSGYTGSKMTFDMVKNQIRERFGEEEAIQYRPTTNCFTYSEWAKKGFRVRKGEKSLKSVTYVEGKDKKTGEERKFAKTIFLFYKTQVDPV